MNYKIQVHEGRGAHKTNTLSMTSNSIKKCIQNNRWSIVVYNYTYLK